METEKKTLTALAALAEALARMTQSFLARVTACGRKDKSRGAFRQQLAEVCTTFKRRQSLTKPTSPPESVKRSGLDKEPLAMGQARP